MRSSVIENNAVILREITIEDLELVRTWRNRPDIRSYMLTQDEISPQQQLGWFRHISAAENQQHFVIYYRHEKIGVANIRGSLGVPVESQTELETAIYIGNEKYRNTLIAFLPAIVLNDYCFDSLGCAKLVAVVLPDNTAALRFNQTLGYQIIAKEPLVKMALERDRFMSATSSIRRLLR